MQVEIQGDDERRFWSKVDGSDGPLRCWVWTDTPNEDGYGRFRLGKKSKLAHRVAWEYLNGSIPEDPATGRPLDLDHECRHRLCVNPWHLDPVTSAENSRRASWYLAANMCKRGHVYTADNERFTSAGSRYCLDCIRVIRAAKKRAA